MPSRGKLSACLFKCLPLAYNIWLLLKTQRQWASRLDWHRSCGYPFSFLHRWNLNIHTKLKQSANFSNIHIVVLCYITYPWGLLRKRSLSIHTCGISLQALLIAYSSPNFDLQCAAFLHNFFVPDSGFKYKRCRPTGDVSKKRWREWKKFMLTPLDQNYCSKKKKLSDKKLRQQGESQTDN